jgi:hypothetical protein
VFVFLLSNDISFRTDKKSCLKNYALKKNNYQTGNAKYLCFDPFKGYCLKCNNIFKWSEFNASLVHFKQAFWLLSTIHIWNIICCCYRFCYGVNWLSSKFDEKLPKNTTDRVWRSSNNQISRSRCLKAFLLLALLTHWNDMSKFKCDCHKDVWSKYAEQFYRRI